MILISFISSNTFLFLQRYWNVISIKRVQFSLNSSFSNYQQIIVYKEVYYI